MNYIHLKHYHTNTARFDHELLDGAISFSEEDLNEKAVCVIAGEKPDDLICSLRGCVSLLVGRYLGNFGGLEPYIDDMVAEGLLAITALCAAIPDEKFRERGILKLATSRAQWSIEKMLNKNRSVMAPSHTIQLQRIRDDKEPVYKTTETNEYSEQTMPEDVGDEAVRDILDAFSKIQPEDEIDIALMDPANWGRGYQELADDLGIGVATVHRRKQRLYQQYLDLTR